MGAVVNIIVCLGLGLGSIEAPKAETWNAVRYSPGLMQKVSRNRGLPIVGCMFSHPTLPIGTWRSITGKTGVTLWCRSTDTSQDVDRPRHIRQRTVELDYQSSKLLCGAKWTGNRKECQVRMSK